ncbi:hypothetical protein [Nocardioides sp.]|uniref:DUF6912 family protein n=1 Tax=Nocardioides sp. TaxID=35761 RepID=UPI0035145601
MRLYVPTTLADLRTALAQAPVPAEALIDGRGDTVVPEGEDEEQEYDALMTAADASQERLAGPGRRVVVVAEVPAGTDPDAPVALRDVVALHADDADRGPDADPDDELSWYATQELDDLLS